MNTKTYKKNDTLPALIITVKADGVAVDLSSYTATFSMTPMDGDRTDPQIDSFPATLVGDGTTGQIQYDWSDGKGLDATAGDLVFTGGSPDTPAEGTYIVDGNGAIDVITISEAGEGYTSAPTVTIENAGSPAPRLEAVIDDDGAVTAINVISDLGISGEYYAEFELDDGNGKIWTVPADDNLKIVVVEDY